MATPPPVQEIEFLAHAKNFAELRERLKALGLVADLNLLTDYAHYIATCWFQLAEQHLAEARSALCANVTETERYEAFIIDYALFRGFRRSPELITLIRKHLDDPRPQTKPGGRGRRIAKAATPKKNRAGGASKKRNASR